MKIFFLLVATLFCSASFNPFDLGVFHKLATSKIGLGRKSQLTQNKNNAVYCPPPSTYTSKLEEIFTNDNRIAAGELRNGVLYLNLEIRKGNWYPESHDGMPITVYALAEAGKPLQIPGPVIRVPEGTRIDATVRNLIVGSTLTLHGFYARPAAGKDSLVIPYAQTCKLQFEVGAAGTYYYRLSANSFKRTNWLPYREDSQLYGALIIDKRGNKIDPNERILMVGMWNDTLNGKMTFNGEEKVINGLSWPYTERLSYHFNQKVKWRLINASNQQHPMHLHGFYFTVLSKSNQRSDLIYKIKDRRKVVTESLRPGESIAMTWQPNRAGNWLFHCHTLVHIGPESVLRKPHTTQGEHTLATHARDGMGGLIMGIQVLSSKKFSSLNHRTLEPKRTLILTAKEQVIQPDTQHVKAFMLEEKSKAIVEPLRVPGPLLLLTLNEPTAIKVINKLSEPTSVHWHGLEIESYFDGVAGWGNKGNLIAPLVMPGDTFLVHITPPRTGTFIYHTHMHNNQLQSGLYGPLIVLKPGERFEPDTDKILLIGQGGPSFEKRKDLLNGKEKPDSMDLKVGFKYRFRLINIKVVGDMKVSFLMDGKPVQWKMVAKDGATIPTHLLTQTSAIQDISIGETMDFELVLKKPGHYVIEVNNPGTNKSINMQVRAQSPTPDS